MSWVIFTFQIIFCFMAVAIYTEYRHGKDIRNLIGAVCYGGAAATSYYLATWWPLAVGFIILMLIRKLGFDPTDDARR